MNVEQIHIDQFRVDQEKEEEMEDGDDDSVPFESDSSLRGRLHPFQLSLSFDRSEGRVLRSGEYVPLSKRSSEYSLVQRVNGLSEEKKKKHAHLTFLSATAQILKRNKQTATEAAEVDSSDPQL